MTKPFMWLLIFLTSVGSICINDANGQTPRGFKIFRPKVETEKGLDVALKAEHGPWLIYAFTLEGSDSKAQALKLTAELRKDFGLNAYIMPKTFDFSNTVVGSGMGYRGQEKVMKYRDDRVIESYSILIGDFSSAELPETKEALAKIKTLQPQFFKTDALAETIEEVTPGETARAYRGWMLGKKSKEKAAKVGPMGAAFLIRNPLLPQDFFEAPEMDSFVTKLNKQADHSILDCPGRFTVRVANFTGGAQMLIGGANVREDENGGNSALARAAEQAHVLTDLLRRAGVEAYEYHDRNCSSVCVGSFEDLGALDSAGQFVYMPEIMQVVQEYGGSKGYESTKYGPLPKAKTLLDVVSYKKFPELTTGTEAKKLAKVKEYTIAFDVTPKPIFVPKPESQSLYRKALLGKN